MTAASPTVLVLGAGINGAAIARELLLNGVSVWLVDAADLASGATSGSSRLIHGGLRYLEYGEFDLVKESLAERTRLLRLAPQFVHPLKLWIPAASRWGGASRRARTILRLALVAHAAAAARTRREPICAGLAFYDAYTNDNSWPRHEVMRATAASMHVDRQKYRWMCSYFDAQVSYPERLVLALLEDARRLAIEQGLDFQVFNYHRAMLRRRRRRDRADRERWITSDRSPRCVRRSSSTPPAPGSMKRCGSWTSIPAV